MVVLLQSISMKKSILLLVIMNALAGLKAQDYLITFNGSGAGSLIDSVRVENLTQRKGVILTGSESLWLREILTRLNYPDEYRDERVRIYPNPVTDYATVEFDVEIPADYIIELSDLSGKRITKTLNNLSQGRQKYQVTGLNPGVYIVIIKSTGYNYTGKILSRNPSFGITQIKYQGQTGNPESGSALKSTQEEYQMQYTSGDRLRFTGYSGVYTTILTDVPNTSKTITFDFVDCTDGDNNNYAALNIGTQVWMAQNLKTTRYNDGSPVPLVTDNNEWRNLQTPAYCWYNNDSATYASEYGALYDYYSFEKGNLCPVGWHVPSSEEWTTLETYLEEKGFGYEGTGDDIGKSLAAVSAWAASEIEGTAGYDQAANNLSGFSAFPGGFRKFDGTFLEIGESGYWWSSSDADCYAFYRNLNYDGINIITQRIEHETGFSVRCIKD